VGLEEQFSQKRYDAFMLFHGGCYQIYDRNYTEALASSRVPDWQGESLENKTLLLLLEMGFGDQLQFVRYARILAERALAADGGALDVPTWVLVDKNPHYTWCRAGRTTPWYRSVRVYRQRQFRDWTNVFEEIRTDLT
jgi:hypothetical protein